MSAIRILCARPGLRRAGVAHTADRTWPADIWSADELAMLRAEPLITVIKIDDENTWEAGKDGREGATTMSDTSIAAGDGAASVSAETASAEANVTVAAAETPDTSHAAAGDPASAAATDSTIPEMHPESEGPGAGDPAGAGGAPEANPKGRRK